MFSVIYVTTLVLTVVLFRWLAPSSLSKIPGPNPSSFLFGNVLELNQYPASRIDIEWQNRYGDLVRFKSIFGLDRLLVSDPKALRHVFNTSPHRYLKRPFHRAFSKMINGKGITWAEGEDHERHRKILLPGFGSLESTAYLMVFKACAESMCMKWMEMLENSTDKRIVPNVSLWLSRATLDAIGQAVFDVQFGTIENDAHPLARAYTNMVNDIFGRFSPRLVFLHEIFNYVPAWIVDWLIGHGSNTRFERARETQRIATQMATKLVREKAEMLLAGKGSKDVFSLLVKANMDAEAKDKLTEEELLAQMRTILFAGHVTTSNTLSWICFELARRPEIQSRLRAEIRKMEAVVRARGEVQFTTADFDAMPFMAAVIKEGLRYYPVVPRVSRFAVQADRLPLARPIFTLRGEIISELVIPKGTEIVVSITAYNRNKALWGEDAHEFNPDRWLDGVANKKKSIPIGMYSNLMTFISGNRGCLGWHFAIVEIQTFLVEIVGKFELAMTEQSEKIIEEPAALLAPFVEGELELGAQLPLAVSVVAQPDDV